MRFVWNCLGVISVLTAGASFAAKPAMADTYALYTLSAANGNVDRAVYADGSAMVAGSSCAATNGDPCYKTYDHGTLTGITPAQPQTAWDNGSACSFTVAGYGVAGRCNGNYEAFAFSQSNPLAQVLTPGVYAGAFDDPGLVYGTAFNSIANLYLNSHGDLAFADTQLEELYQAYNTTPAPEPGTLVLLMTGLGLGVVVQRKLLA